MGITGEDDWQEVADARAEALALVLGPVDNMVFHAPHPFALGGQADVLSFSHHLAGLVYVTSELTGKPGACYADYELMICHRTSDQWGPNVISRLAPYTQQSRIGTGETMSIDSATPLNSKIKAFLFDTYATFNMFGQACELRLCIGITNPELKFKLEYGPASLLERLRRSGVYPFTDLDRDSVPLEE